MIKYQYIIMNHDYQDELHDDGLIEEVSYQLYDSEDAARDAAKEFIKQNEEATGVHQDLEINVHRIDTTQGKPSLDEIKRVLQYLDEELLVEGSFEDVCEYIQGLESIQSGGK